MADTKISGLSAGTPKATDLYIGVDTTDPSMAPTGTDKKYTRSDDAAYVASTIALAGDVTGALGANVIGTNAVTNAKSAQMAANTIKGNNTGSTANAIDLTVSEVKSELGYGTMADQNANSVDIIGGTIDGTSIGSTTPSDITATSITETTFSTDGIVHNSIGGLFSTSLLVNADVDAAAAIVDTKLATISTAGKVSNSATTATDSNTPSTIVLRDGSGNFAAGTITANLSGTATNFSGALSGDVTGTQSATSIPANSITNAKLSQMASNTFKGNNTLSLGNPVDLTIAQAKTMLGIVGSVSVSPTQIGFGDISSNLVGSANLTWTDSTKVLALASGSEVNLGSSTTSRGVVLFNGSANAHQYYGINVNSGATVYHVDQTISSHIFRCGLTSTTSQDLFNIGGNKIVSTIAGGGMQFGNSTVSYTPATLNYYEEFSTTLTIGGPWTNRTIPAKFIRLGNLVTLRFGNFSPVQVTVSDAINLVSPVLPARFLPSGAPTNPADNIVIEESPTSTGIGKNGLFLIIGTTFQITDEDSAPFTIGRYAGIRSGACVSWML